MTTGQQMDLLTDRIIKTALDAVRIEGRLREYVSDAIERAPGFAAWCRQLYESGAGSRRVLSGSGEPGHSDTRPAPTRQDELDDIAVWLETRQ